MAATLWDELYDIFGLLDEICVEDGRCHPAEPLLVELDSKIEPSQWLDNLPEIMSSSVAPDFIRLMGRCIDGTPKLRHAIVAAALKHQNIDFRDAGIQAAESWNDPWLSKLLVGHNDRKSWLQSYANDVGHSLMEFYTPITTMELVDSID